MRVAIVGGGWAGLSAAVELAGAGVTVTVFEAAKQLGGRARSVDLRPGRLDNGQHLLVGAYHETLRLMREVGADPERLLKRLPFEICFPGSQPASFRMRLPKLRAPWHLAAGLLSCRGATLSEKWRALRCMRSLQLAGYRLAADETVATLLDGHRQTGNLRRYLWEPLCLAALNTSPENASAQVFLNTLRDSLGGQPTATDLLLPAADLDQLFPAPAARFIVAHGGTIRLSTRVDRLDGHFTVTGEPFDCAVLAVGPQHAAALLATRDETRPLARLLADYRFEPIGTVYCAYPPELRLPWPMLGLAAGDATRLGQWAFDRGALGGTAGLIAFVLSGHGQWEQVDNQTLVAALHGELASVLRVRLPPPTWHQVIRERRATFSCRPGLARPPSASALAGLWLAGDYVCADYPATLEAAVRSGVTAARAILLK